MDDLAKQIAEKVIADTKYFSALIGFMGVMCGSIISIIGSIILHRLSAKKERQQQILKKELDRLYQLEELAGEITEWAGSWQLKQESPELREKFQKFMVAAGTFRKYPKLKQAIRDLNQHAMILTSDKINREDPREGSKELEEMYEAFITEYKDVLNKIET
jgi:gas vesicle protein